MIRLNPDRYDKFKEVYFNTVIDLLHDHSLNLKKNGSISLKKGKKRLELEALQFQDELSLFRELVWYLNDYDIYTCLTGEGTGFEQRSSLKKEDIEKMDFHALAEALRPLILGKAETLINAWELLLDSEHSGRKTRCFSHEIQNVMKENELKFCLNDRKLHPNALLPPDSTVTGFIPCPEEGKIRTCYKKKEKPSAAVEEVCELLEKRWRFLEYLYYKAYEDLRDKKPVCENASWKKMTVSTCLVSLLELRSCPYCNRNYIGTVRGKNLGYQLDHFINKSKYPFFCLSLYNLVPSCTLCNGRKHDKDIGGILSPFEARADYDHALEFHYVPPLLSEDEQGEVEILLKSGDQEMDDRCRKTLDVFDLDDSYKFNRDEADEFIRKMIYYPPSMIAELGRIISPSDSSLLAELHIEADLFREGMEEPDSYYRQPLSMMYRHFYRKYRE